MIGPKGYFGKNCDIQTPLCPRNDSQYGLMENTCIYFEKTKLTYDKAIENCKEKLKDYGGGILYEPYSIAEQKRIVAMAYERGSIKNSHSWYWIGVTDNISEEQYTYNSNGQPINFNPDWLLGGGKRGRNNNFIGLSVSAPSNQYYSEWYDYISTTSIRSICWSIN